MNERHAVVLVAVGGFVGATARYVAGLVLPPLVSTFTANVVGCFALGWLLYSYRLDAVSERLRLLTATGFLSSFTTYSTFAHEAFEKLPAVAVVYVVASYGVGFFAVYAGTRTALRGKS